MTLAKVLATILIWSIFLLWLIWSILNMPDKGNTPGIKDRALGPMIIAATIALAALLMLAITLTGLVWVGA